MNAEKPSMQLISSKNIKNIFVSYLGLCTNLKIISVAQVVLKLKMQTTQKNLFIKTSPYEISLHRTGPVIA